MPRPWASSRAPRTACAEQQLALAVVLGVGPQLERDADGLGAVAGDEQGGDGAVDAAAHRDERARGGRREPRLLARGPAERAVQRVGGELGGVALGGAEPAELRVRSRSGPIRAASSSGAPRIRPTTALPAAIAAPQPLASKPASRIRPSALLGSTASEMRTRSPQAAPPAAPVCASAGSVAAPERVFEVLLQAFGGASHASEFKATWPA